MSTAILTRAGAGVAGEITRFGANNRIEPFMLDATNPPTAFGVAGVYENSRLRKFASGDTGADVCALIARQAPHLGGADDQSFTAATPNKSVPQGGMKEGYMNVVCAIGTPVRGGAVYIRTVADTGKVIGDFEATEALAKTGTAGAMVGTGNATAGTITALDATPAGAYIVRMLTATTFEVESPSNDIYGNGANGVAFTTPDGLTFTVTAGATPAVAGDTITITVADGSQNDLVPGLKWAVDGKDSGNITEVHVDL